MLCFFTREVIHASTENRFLDQVSDRLRLKNYAYRTEKSDLYWIKHYILFHKAKQGYARHPNEIGGAKCVYWIEPPGRNKKI